jgi:predicted kinase
VPEAVVLCGIQGAGKTTFYGARFAASHAHVSLDALKTSDREREAIEECVSAGRSFVIDRTNATPDHRAPYVEAARLAGYEALAYWLDVRPSDAIARNAEREGPARIPVRNIVATYERLRVPALEEGFARIYRVVPLAGRKFHVEPHVADSGQQSFVL